MIDLDEVVARALSTPVAAPPDLATIERRARRHHRHRIAGRVVVASASAAVLSLGAVVLVSVGGTPSRTTSAPRGTPPGDAQAITHPVLESCAATSAREGVQTGAGKSDPDEPGEVFADPARGVEGPLAVLLRRPGSGGLGGLGPNMVVAGRPAAFVAGDRGQSGIRWVLADGGVAVLYALDLAESDVHALAGAIDGGASPLPGGLVSLGMTTGASWAYSSCGDPVLGSTDVEVIRGSVASRYARALAGAPGYRWDDGDVTFLVTAPPGAEPTNRPAVRQATPDEWAALVASAQE